MLLKQCTYNVSFVYLTLHHSYRAYDTEEGIEVAWNQIKLTNVAQAQKKKMLQEINILEQLTHESIMDIYDSWKLMMENI